LEKECWLPGVFCNSGDMRANLTTVTTIIMCCKRGLIKYCGCTAFLLSILVATTSKITSNDIWFSCRTRRLPTVWLSYHRHRAFASSRTSPPPENYHREHPPSWLKLRFGVVGLLFSITVRVNVFIFIHHKGRKQNKAKQT